MTWTYNTAPFDDVAKVRLLIADNDIVPITDAHFSDEEIQVFLTMAGDDTYWAAALALQSWAGFLSSSTDSERIGDYSYTKKQVANKLELAEKYLSASGAGPIVDWASMDLESVGEYPVEESE